MAEMPPRRLLRSYHVVQSKSQQLPQTRAALPQNPANIKAGGAKRKEQGAEILLLVLDEEERANAATETTQTSIRKSLKRRKEGGFGEGRSSKGL
jgi:hypothetical protein